ncbi:hypothetical protein K2173_020242 [Erythroxylum novogranatense]|uniref:Thioredoxin domain-containing protein n=1 Tax=Erythroxylum novogranatense TaxID=1862640 RepID=A0AAV8UAB0_9ROSI|nr:hypothetical protein K2173_020242 [Erythroxylum novogranatense]
MGSLLSALCKIAGHSSEDDAGVNVFHSVDNWQRHFMAVKDSTQLMAIDFAASWCGPCKFMEPAVRAMFVKIDVDELPEVSREFGIETMPTFVLVKRGKEVDRVVGPDEDELEKTVAKHREASTTCT